MTRLLMVSTIAPTLNAFLLPFAHHFRALGWQVDGMANGISQCENCKATFDHTWEAAWSRNPLDPRNLVRLPGHVRRLVEREGYDLVHVHTPVGAFVTRYALRGLRQRRRVQVIYTAHGFHFYQGGQRWKNAAFVALEKMAGRWTDYLVVINHEDEQAAQEYQLVPPDRVRYMPGIGVDTDHYRPTMVSSAEVEAVRAEIGLGPEDKLLLMVAEFIPRKRHEDVLRAFAQLERPHAHLAFAGRGPLMESMKALALELGVSERSHFIGYRNDIPAVMRACVATILPSEQEGLPRSVMESLSLQVPVIGSDIRGTRGLLQEGGGRLFALGNTAELTETMAWFADHGPEAAEMGRRGREQMVAVYAQQHIVALHSGLYAEALGQDTRALGHKAVGQVYNRTI